MQRKAQGNNKLADENRKHDIPPKAGTSKVGESERHTMAHLGYVCSACWFCNSGRNISLLEMENAFVYLAQVNRAMRKADYTKEEIAEAMKDMQSGDYENLVSKARDYLAQAMIASA